MTSNGTLHSKEKKLDELVHSSDYTSTKKKKKKAKNSRIDGCQSIPEEKNLKNGISIKEKQLVKQYISELHNLKTDFSKLDTELFRQKSKQAKLKKTLEKAKKNPTLPSIVSQSSLKKKLEDEKEVISKKQMKKGVKPLKDRLILKPAGDIEETEKIVSEKKKKKKRKKNKLSEETAPETLSVVQENDVKNKPRDVISSYLQSKNKAKLQERLKSVLSQGTPKKKPILSLREKMMEKLKAARFRFLNEQIYTTDSKEAQKIFKSDPDAFQAYHEGYRQQVKSWPLNPLDVIIKSIKKMPKNHVVADFGCGDARLSRSVDQKVHSFDLVAANDTVTACDMAHVPLEADSVTVAVFCLSLMGTNLHDYLLEANRVLKVGGCLKVAEVESRFENVDSFIEGVQRFGFKKTWKDLSHNLFYFLDFKKENTVKNKKKLPTISLLPCLYKT